MLEQMRNNSGSLITYVLFSMIIIVFIFTFGAVDPSEACRGGAVESVAEINGEEVSEKDLTMAARLIPDFPAPRSQSQRAVTDRVYYRQFRYPYTPLRGKYVNRASVCPSLLGCIDFGVRPGMAELQVDPREIPVVEPQKAMEHLTETLLVSDAADQLGLVTSNDELRDRVKPQFINPDKTFDKERWLGHVNRSGAGASRYEAFLKQELQREKLIALNLSGLVVSDYELSFYHRLANEKVRVEFVEVSDAAAQSMIKVTDEDVTTWLKEEKNEKATKADYMKNKDTLHANPKRFVFQTASVDAGSTKDAIAKEADADKKKALEDARKANGVKANELATTKPGADAAVAIYQAKDLTEADIKAELGDEVLKALSEMKAGDAGKVVETDKAFVIVHLTRTVEASVKSYDEVKAAVANGLIAKERTPAFKKKVADELLAAVKADSAKSLEDHAKAIGTKYGAPEGLTVGDSGMVARVLSNRTIYPMQNVLDRGTSLRDLGDMGRAGNSMGLLKAAFAASKENPLLPEVYENTKKSLIVAKFAEREDAGAMEEVDDIRDALLNDKEQNTYLAWYGKYRQEKDAKVVPTEVYEQAINAAKKLWIEGGGLVAGMPLPVPTAEGATPQ